MHTNGTGGRTEGGVESFLSCIFSFAFLPERLSTLGGASYDMHTSGTGGRARSGICFVCFHPCIFPLIFLPGCVGDRGCKRRSTLGGTAYDTHTSGMGELAREDVFGGAMYFSIYVIGSLIG